MSDWDVILDEAEWLALQFQRRAVDLSEAKKVGDYYVAKNCDDDLMARFLALMARNPPPRSRHSQRHFKNLWHIWQNWRTDLVGRDKARAWGWAVRVAKPSR